MPSVGPTYPTASSGWITNPNNVNAADAAYAYDACSRTFDPYDSTYSSVDTNLLLCDSFTGLATGIGASDTIDGIKVEIVNAGYETGGGGASFNNFNVYLYNGATNVGTKSATIVSSALQDYTLGGATDNWSAGFTGADIANLKLTVEGRKTTGSGTAIVMIDAVRVTIYYTSASTAPNPFSFTDAPGVELSTLTTSDYVTMTGMTGTVTATCSGGEMEVNNSGIWAASGSVSNGNVIRVRQYSSASYSTAVNVVLDVYGTTDTFTITTRAVDSVPAAFSFGTSYTSTAGATQYSGVVYLSGCDAGVGMAATFAGTGQYRVNFGAWGSGATTVYYGDAIEVATAAPATPGTNTGTVTVNGVSGSFNSTLLGDTTPDAFTFTPEVGASTSTTYTSNTVVISGVNDTCAVSFTTSGGTSHEYSKNGGAWTAVGATTAVVGDTFALRMVSPAAAASVGSVTITVGGTSASWTVSTGADATPDAFSFTAVTGATPDTDYTSNSVVIAGLGGGVSVTATIVGGTFDVNGGGYLSTPQAVTNGDTVTVRLHTSTIPGAVTTATLTIDTVSGAYVVTNRSVAYAFDF